MFPSQDEVLLDMTVKSSEGNRCYIIFCELSWHLASIVLQSADKHTPWQSVPKVQCYKHKILPSLSQFSSVHIQPISLNTWRKQIVHACYMPCNVHALWTKIKCCESICTTPITLHIISIILHRISWKSHCTEIHSISKHFLLFQLMHTIIKS